MGSGKEKKRKHKKEDKKEKKKYKTSSDDALARMNLETGVAFVKDLCLEYPSLASDLIQIFKMVDTGEAVVIGGLENKDIRNKLEQLFPLLGLIESGPGGAYIKHKVAKKIKLSEKLHDILEKPQVDEPIKKPKDKPLPKRSAPIGPQRPPTNQTKVTKNTEDDDYVGPALPGMPGFREASAQVEAEMQIRAKSLEKEEWDRVRGVATKDSSSSKPITQREEWMLSLPDDKSIQAALGGLGDQSHRKFRSRDKDERDDSWFASPEERQKALREQTQMDLLGYVPGASTSKPNASSQTLEVPEDEEPVQPIQRQGKSLLEMHQEKQSTTAKPNDGSFNWDRDRDISNRREMSRDKAQELIRQANEMSSRFAAPKMSRVKEQLDQLGALVLDAAEQITADVDTQRALLRAVCALKIALLNILQEPGAKKEVVATNLLRCLLMSINAYHNRQNGADSIVQVMCDVLVHAYDVGATNDCLEVLLNKTAPLYAKLTIVRAMAQLDYSYLATATPLLTELIALTNKHIRHTDIYVRHTLLFALTGVLRQYGFHAAMYHAEMVRIAAKAAADKCPEIRSVAGEMLFVLMDATDINEPSGAILDAIFHVLVKTIEDPAPEIRRVMGINMGKLLSMYILRGDRHTPDVSSSVVPAPPIEHTNDDADHRFRSLNFKLSTVLNRKTKLPIGIATVPQALHYIKENFCSLQTGTTVGGVYASSAIIAANMCEFLPDNYVQEPVFASIFEALLHWLDFQSLPSANEYVRARNAIGYTLRRLSHTFTERTQHQWLSVLLQHIDAAQWNHHQRLVLIIEASHMFQTLGEACVVYYGQAFTTLNKWLNYEKHSLRLESAVAIASLAVAVPYRRNNLLFTVLSNLDKHVKEFLTTTSAVDTSILYSIHGQATAVAHVLRALKIQGSGVSSQQYLHILEVAESMIETQFQATYSDAIWLTCTRAGWDIISALIAMDPSFTRSITTRLCQLWLKTSVPQVRDASQELLRMEGAVIALYCFWFFKPDGDGLGTLTSQLLHSTLLAAVNFGTPTKQRAKVAKHRVLSWTIKCFQCLPPALFADSWMILLDMIAEFTTAQPLTSLARASLLPPTTTYLTSQQTTDEVLDILSPLRMVAGDSPDPMLPKGLNLILTLLLPDTAMSDIEMETAYLDNFLLQIHPHDPTSLNHLNSSFTYVRMVDACVSLFPAIFLSVPEELQLRCLQHYAAILGDPRIDCISNICAMLLATVREGQAQIRDATKPTTSFQNAAWLASIRSMLMEMLGSPSSSIRRSAAEALGTIASLSCDTRIETLVQDLETKLTQEQQNNQSFVLAGSALALAYVKRSCGSRSSVDVTLLYRLNQDHVFSMAQPIRTWCLHAWNLLLECVNTSGDYEEQYVVPSLALIDSHLLAGTRFTPLSCTYKKSVVLRMNTSVCASLGQILNSIVSALGPELLQDPRQIDEIYSIWDFLRLQSYAHVEYEYLRFIEQLVLFAPSYFRVADLAMIKTKLLDKTTPSACRSIMLLILRILVERDASLIVTHELHVMLFLALDLHERIVDWTMMPFWRGLFFTISRKTWMAQKLSSTTEIQGCINALLITDCGRLSLANGNASCQWLLFCRGIAVGGVTSMIESPRSRENSNKEYDNISAALDLWRATNHKISALLNPLPCLRRRVREFAVQCVLCVLDYVYNSKVSSIHFDVAASREAIQTNLTKDPSNRLDDVNFVSLYLDELVTLGCQISAFSIDGFELQHLQSVGMKLLNVVCERFASCIDPDVEESTNILTQYQAQLSSTIRRAFPKTTDGTTIYELLTMEGYSMMAHVICNDIISSSDKVAIQRLLKLGFTSDYTFAAQNCPNALGFQLSMTALSSIARMYRSLCDRYANLFDTSSLEVAWLNAVKDFCALHIGPGTSAGDFKGVYFTSAYPQDVLRSISIQYIAPILATLCGFKHEQFALTATLLYFAQTSKNSDPQSTVLLLQALPQVCKGWTLIESYENVLQTLLLLCSSCHNNVQIEALKNIQYLVTKEGAEFLTSRLEQLEFIEKNALLHLIELATTYILRYVTSTKNKVFPSNLLSEAMRTAVAGTMLLSPHGNTQQFGPGFVLIAKDMFLKYYKDSWFQSIGGVFVESTIRFALKGSSSSALVQALSSFLDSLEQCLSLPDQNQESMQFLADVINGVLTNSNNLPELITNALLFHSHLAPVLASRLQTDGVHCDGVVRVLGALCDHAPTMYLADFGPIVISLISPSLSSSLLDEIDNFFQVVLRKMTPLYIETLLQILLPVLLPLQSTHPAIVNRMLVAYATTYSVQFKGAISNLSMELKNNLEMALRSALSRPSAPIPQISTSKLQVDFSRYG
ncbi:hypothetical protein THRCLA_01041 [Thraustotheca clavata]|uniref:DUF3752 domain-containing protein n=1 Tax=Thraustotheca clavata TaxID=74557 RepID=A0A1W0AA82_9STRA|nr:hypothetical protein THRCLA_01041 [Thraustotheca clavata]